MNEKWKYVFNYFGHTQVLNLHTYSKQIHNVKDTATPLDLISPVVAWSEYISQAKTAQVYRQLSDRRQ